MKLISTTLFTLLLAVAGCGKEEPISPKASPGPTAAAPVAMPSLQTDATPPPPGRENAPAPGGTAASAPASSAADSSLSNRPVDASGEPLSDLEWLNRLVEAYHMRASTSDPASQLAGRKFKNQDEEMAAIAAIRVKNRVAVRDLSDLVKAGLIKSIPAAPPGKKYVIDQKSGQVVMANQ